MLARCLINHFFLKNRIKGFYRFDSSTSAAGVPYKSTFKDVRTETATSVPPSADVVIIGGGVIGCASFYHLTKLGVRNVVLLEKDNITAGTTWHTAGLVWHLRPSDVEVELLSYSWDLMKSLEDETGINTGYIQNGGLFIASNKERLDEYKRLHSLGKVFGIESHVLGPSATGVLYPLMNVSDVYGTLYSPSDGTIDPAGYCSALVRGATSRGGKIVTKCRVTDIETSENSFGRKQVQTVVTDKGSIKTNAIVNAAGVWSPYIGAFAGVKVPLCAMKHAYVVTERIEGIQNMPNVRDHDASVYLRLQGDALSIGGYESNPVFWEHVEKDFGFSLFELDWDVFGVHIAGAVNRVPQLAEVGVKSTVCGPESFTPDHKPLLGEDPAVRGFFHACGYNSGGMMQSGGTTRELAKWIVQGAPDVDMFSYDIRRFTQRLCDNTKYIRERSHEAYAKNYSIVFKHDEPLAGRTETHRGALHDVLESAGCMFQERHGFERPGWFSASSAPTKDYRYYGYYGFEEHKDYTYYDNLHKDYTFDLPENHGAIMDECRACRESAAAFDMSYFGKLYLTGPDAAKVVDWVFTADMRRPPGSTVYTCMLNTKGGIEADITVSVLQDGFYLAIGGAIAEHVKTHLRNVIEERAFDCKIQDSSLDQTLLSIQGPKSREILAQLTDVSLENADFPFSSHKECRVAGKPVRLIRLSFVGEMGWEIHVANEHAVHIHQAVMATGLVRNAGYRAIDCLSAEKGYRHWHADIRGDDSPLEAGLAFTCKLKTDIPFLGREALEKIREAGLRRRLICLTLDSNPSVYLHGLEAIMRDNIPVGFVRRAEHTFSLNRPIAYGYVSNNGEKVTPDWLKAGKFEVERMGERFPATLHLKSPFDPLNLRVKGQY